MPPVLACQASIRRPMDSQKSDKQLLLIANVPRIERPNN
jgi:hypothetical protein